MKHKVRTNKLTCDLCEDQFETKLKLEEHIELIHKEKEKENGGNSMCSASGGRLLGV